LSSSQNGIEKGALERLNFRVEPELKAKFEEMAARDGFKSVSAYIRHRLFKAPDEKAAAKQVADVEQKTVATINRLSKDMNQLRIQLLAAYCLVDGLAKVILTCLPEPSPEVADQATANAKRRYERLNRAVAQAMRGEGAAILQELSKYVGE
jgi:Arc/MetJ-type ribon-helix-helix transcriptional regulator